MGEGQVSKEVMINLRVSILSEEHQE